jgi:hypothetical protein
MPCKAAQCVAATIVLRPQAGSGADAAPKSRKQGRSGRAYDKAYAASRWVWAVRIKATTHNTYEYVLRWSIVAHDRLLGLTWNIWC